MPRIIHLKKKRKEIKAKQVMEQMEDNEMNT